MGAPQFRQRPRSATHVTSGRFRYHGMEYLQCGQCDRRRDDAHAQRQPVDAHVQKTAGDAAEHEKAQRPEMERHEGPVVCVEHRVNAHKRLFERAAHHVERRGFAGPDFKCLGALVQQHAQTVGGFAAGGLGRLEQVRFRRIVNHVINRAGLTQRKWRSIQRRGVAGLQAERRGIQQQIHRPFGKTHRHLHLRMPLADFLRHRLGLGAHEIHQKQFGHVFRCQPQSRHLPCPAGAEQQHFQAGPVPARSSRNERPMPSASVLKPCDRIRRGIVLRIGAAAAIAAGVRASNRTVLTAPHVLADSSSASTISIASNLCGTVRFRPANCIAWRRRWRRADCRDDFKREVTPVQAERGERGVVHRGRRGMADGKTIDRATARGGIDGGLSRFRHAKFISGNGASSKRKVRPPAYFQSASALRRLHHVIK